MYLNSSKCGLKCGLAQNSEVKDLVELTSCDEVRKQNNTDGWLFLTF